MCTQIKHVWFGEAMPVTPVKDLVQDWVTSLVQRNGLQYLQHFPGLCTWVRFSAFPIFNYFDWAWNQSPASYNNAFCICTWHSQPNLCKESFLVEQHSREEWLFIKTFKYMYIYIYVCWQMLHKCYSLSWQNSTFAVTGDFLRETGINYPSGSILFAGCEEGGSKSSASKALLTQLWPWNWLSIVQTCAEEIGVFKIWAGASVQLLTCVFFHNDNFVY